MEQGQQTSDTPIRTIKRYANRKLYDMTDSSYVTLDEIAQFVKNGEEVRVVDNKSKEDLTAVTLTQIIFEEEKRKKRVLPLSTLRGVIQSGGEFIHKRITEPVTNFRSEAERTFASLREDAERTVNRLVKRDRANEVVGLVRRFFEDTQQFYDEIQKRVEEQVGTVLANMPLTGELEQLKAKVTNLENIIKKRNLDD